MTDEGGGETANDAGEAVVAPLLEPRIPASLSVATDLATGDPQFPDIDGATLDGVTLTRPDARILTVLRSRLSSVTLDVGEATLDAQDTQLSDVDLTGRRVDGLVRVRLVRCRLTGADLAEARLRDVVFDDCALDLASMRMAELERVRFRGGRADELDLTGARLTDASFTDLRLDGVILEGTRMARIDLTEADLDGVTDMAVLKGATISATQAVSLAPRLARAAGLQVAAPLR